ncbi:aromatic ring-hydroxylating dioxygenase subunit alpha [Hydrogenophaga sp. 5NK40-0174]|uniref:aromatic ring-hydroxylating dioxygenase subunit alpha n=1 Tax=Hydrogenophaga sp. 5NK40-0174 TaxID=3127649 RepID=UPI0031085A3E
MSHSIERQIWHPVLTSTELREEPVAVELLGEPLVLWREAGHEAGHGMAAMAPVVHAWQDRCPHRGARLSLGRVLRHLRGARLECPYHGWQFAGTTASLPVSAANGNGAGQLRPVAVGQCALVPSVPAFEAPDSHCTTVHDAVERGGLIWVRLQRPETSLPVALTDVPEQAEWADVTWRHLVCGQYEVQTSAARLMENFLDLSHFGFVHEGYLGSRNHAQVDTGSVAESDDGVEATQCKAWQPQGYAGEVHGAAVQGRWVDYAYEVKHPFVATLRKMASGDDDQVSNVITIAVRPDGDEACTAWFSMATHGDVSSDLELREFQDTIFLQDLPIIESQQPKALPIGKDGSIKEVHGPSDRMSSAYRRYLARVGVSVGVC